MVKAAQSKNGEIKFLAYPWNSPAFMKTKGEMNHGGKHTQNLEVCAFRNPDGELVLLVYHF